MKSKVTIFFIALFLCVCSFSVQAQLKKADIQQLMTDVGVTEQDIKEFHLKNVVTTYTNGNWTRSTDSFKKSEYQILSISLTESGINLKWEDEGEKCSSLYPYSGIKKVFIKKSGIMGVELKD